ncbi:MAG: tripartite tricarboxylate transporter substrate binding protein [Pseudomonadota bacterium]|jgi:tripartite-type tricarboxylate transporter receptor subunit TctC
MSIQVRSFACVAGRAPTAVMRGVAGLVMLGALASPPVLAQPAWPAKPVRLVLPFPPGGGTDILGRTIGQRLSDALGQPVLTDNRPGAGGNLGAEIVARSAPDGYTFVLVAPGLVISPSLYPKLGFDPFRDFTPVSLVAVIPNLLVVHPSVPVHSVKELVAYARANPGRINYGSGGVGTSNHLGTELIAVRNGLKLVHVPYKGAATAMMDTVAGNLQLITIGTGAALAQIRAGKLRALATLTPGRVANAPEIPTIAEAGFPGMEVLTWYAILGPAKTPGSIVSRLNHELSRIMFEPDVRERLSTIGAEPMKSSPAELTAFMRTEFQRWAEVVKAAGIRAE